MTLPRVDESRLGFFGPFYKTHSGALFGLASAAEGIRDGLAFALVARYFSLPEFEGITLEPSRRNIQPPENLILLGSSSLFVDPLAHKTSGGPPAKVEGKELQDRIDQVVAPCCFQFKGSANRVVVNKITDEIYRPERDEKSGKFVDYGVIRRVFRPGENTVCLEGVHRVGTLGVAKAAMNENSLNAIWDAVNKLEPAFDESLPLEILVRATFYDQLKDGVYAIDSITAVPLFVVYNRQWIFDLTGDRRWVDQLPWDIHRIARKEDPPEDASSDGPGGLPRVEIEANLRDLDPKVRKLAEELLTKRVEPIDTDAPPPPNARQKKLLRALVTDVNLFRMVLVGVKFTALGNEAILPQGRTRIRILRKQFFLHLALCRMLGCGFRCNEAAIRAYFPKFRSETTGKKFTTKFVGSVPGRMREGFEALLGPAANPMDYIHIDYARTEQTYSLRLEKASLVLRLRV
jgi:hypothetical protein